MTLFTFVMHALSWWLSFEVTLPRIAVATYALVTVSDVQKSVSTLLVTTTRVLGIMVGVVVALLVTTFVLPHSATDAVRWCRLAHFPIYFLRIHSRGKLNFSEKATLSNLIGAEGAAQIAAVSACPARNRVGQRKPRIGTGCDAEGEASMGSQALCASTVRLGLLGMHTLRSAPHDGKAWHVSFRHNDASLDPMEWHDVNAALHDALTKVRPAVDGEKPFPNHHCEVLPKDERGMWHQVNRLAAASQMEAYLGSIFGARFFLPTLLPKCVWGPCWLPRYTLPEEALYRMAKHCQHTARVLWVLLHLMEHGFEAEMKQVWWLRLYVGC